MVLHAAHGLAWELDGWSGWAAGAARSPEPPWFNLYARCFPSARCSVGSARTFRTGIYVQAGQKKFAHHQHLISFFLSHSRFLPSLSFRLDFRKTTHASPCSTVALATVYISASFSGKLVVGKLGVQRQEFGGRAVAARRRGGRLIESTGAIVPSPVWPPASSRIRTCLAFLSKDFIASGGGADAIFRWRPGLLESGGVWSVLTFMRAVSGGSKIRALGEMVVVDGALAGVWTEGEGCMIWMMV